MSGSVEVSEPSSSRKLRDGKEMEMGDGVQRASGGGERKPGGSERRDMRLHAFAHRDTQENDTGEQH